MELRHGPPAKCRWPAHGQVVPVLSRSLAAGGAGKSCDHFCGLVSIGRSGVTNENRKGAAVSVQSALIAAIRNRKVVEFKDAGGYARIGEPHLLGVCAETGTTRLEVFQTDGDKSRSGSHLPQWRQFAIADIWNLQTTAIEFTPRADFDPRSARWSRVIASVCE